MPIPSTLPMSQFNGKVFVSTSHAVRNLFEVPSVTLAASHPFWQLWQCHLQSLTQPDSLFEGVIDSLAAILRGDPLWKETSMPTEISQIRSDVRSLLLNSPPNIIILKNYRHYGCHERCTPLWNYICISKRYVKLWVDADDEMQRQGLAALLVTVIDHELGHWAQTINSRYCHLSPVRCIPMTNDFIDLLTDDLSTDFTTDFATDPFASLDVSDDDESLSDAGDDTDKEVSSFESPSDDISTSPSEPMDDMPKLFQAPWMAGGGEAGNFVELSTRGGIMEYDAIVKQPYLVVGRHESDLHFLSGSYLKLYHQNNGPSTSLIFRPASRSSKSSRLGLKIKGVAFPFGGVDRCLSTQTPDSLYQRNYHGYVPTKVHKL